MVRLTHSQRTEIGPAVTETQDHGVGVTRLSKQEFESLLHFHRLHKSDVGPYRGHKPGMSSYRTGWVGRLITSLSLNPYVGSEQLVRAAVLDGGSLYFMFFNRCAYRVRLDAVHKIGLSASWPQVVRKNAILFSAGGQRFSTPLVFAFDRRHDRGFLSRLSSMAAV